VHRGLFADWLDRLELCFAQLQLADRRERRDLALEARLIIPRLRRGEGGGTREKACSGKKE
jgi:hypothetical protein